MKLQDIFRQLTSGELSQVSLGLGGTVGSIAEEHWGKVIDHTNLGLTALFTRFKLKENSMLLTLVQNQNTYALDAPDLLKAERVYTDAGIELKLNDGGDILSVHTPDTFTLWVPKAVVNGGPDLPDSLKTLGLKVVYRAGHPQIKLDDVIDPEMTDVLLPYTYLQALLYFIASRVHNPLGTGQFEFNAGNNWAAKYEMECQRLENSGLAIDTVVGNDRLARNGWV